MSNASVEKAVEVAISNSLLICSVEKTADEIKVFDCNCSNEPILITSFQNPEASSGSPNRELNSHYEENRNTLNNKDYSNTWFLVGEKKDGSQTVIQVGQTSSWVAMKGELNTNRNALIFRDPDNENVGKYGELLNKYDKCSFYEVDIDRYFTDEEFEEIFCTARFNNDMIYYYIKSLCAEGKLAAKTNTDEQLWRGSGSVDSMAFDLYKNKKSS